MNTGNMLKAGRIVAVAGSLLLALASPTWAGDVSIPASGEIWIRQVSPDSTFEGDLISIWASNSIGPDAGNARYGLVEFDLSSLSGLAIQGAELRLYSILGGSTGSGLPIKQSAYIIDSGGTPLTSLTWNLYQSEKNATKVSLESLGAYDLPPTDTTPAIQNVYVGSEASAADLALVQAEIDGDGKLSVVLIAAEDGTDYRQDWGDGAYAGLVPLLVVDDGLSCNITTESLPNAIEGDPYSAFVQDDGGCTGKSWSIVSGALPDGLNLNNSTGQISGVADGLGTFNFEVQLQANEAIRTKALSILVTDVQQGISIPAGADVWIRELSPNSFFENDWVSVWSANNQHFEDAGFRRYGLVEFDVSSLAGKDLTKASLSLAGLALNGAGTKQSVFRIASTGATPLTSSTWNTYQSERAASAAGFQTFGRYDLTALPGVNQYVTSGQASAADLAAIEAEASGDGKLTLALIADEDGTDYRADWGDAGAVGLPPILNVDDGSVCYILTETLPDGEVGSAYGPQALQATGACAGTLSWSVESGDLPDGLSLSAGGQISGTPEVTGIFEFQVRLDSSNGYFRRKTLILTIGGGSRGNFTASGDSWVRQFSPLATFENDLVSIWSSASQDGGQGAAARKGLVEFNVSGLAGADLVGARLSLYATRAGFPFKQQVSMFPTGPAVGSLSWNSFHGHVANNGGLTPFTRFGGYDLGISEGLNSYVNSMQATDADLAIIEAEASGDGVLSIVLEAVEDGTVYEQDWGDAANTGNPPLLVVDIGGGCVIITASVPNPQFGQPYSTMLEASPSCGAPSWELRECFPPPGLTLNPATGEISGRAGLAGLYTFTVGLSGFPQQIELSMEVPESPADIDQDGDVDGADFTAFNAAFTGPGGPSSCQPSSSPSLTTLEAVADVWLREIGPNTTFENDWVSVWSSLSNDRRYGMYEWDLSSLAGQTITGAKMELWSGNAFSGRNYPLKQTARVIDTTGGTGILNMTWNQLQAQHSGLGTALEGLGRFDQGPSIDDGTAGTYTSDFGATAADLAMLQGVANGTGRLTLVLVADEDGTQYRRDWGDGANAGGPGYQASTPARLLIRTGASTCGIANFSLPSGQVGVPYSATLEALAGCTGTPQWQITECALPPGLLLNASSGAISGTPELSGTYGFTVRLTTNQGAITDVLSIQIVGEAPEDFDGDGDVDLVDYHAFSLAYGGPFSRTLCGTVEFPSADVPKQVPDGGSVTSTVTIPAGVSVADVNVFVDATHPEMLDLEIKLRSPQGTTVFLEDFNDFGSGAYTARTYDDEGAFPPLGDLSNFDGQNATGTWTLTVSDFDNVIVDNPVLNNWTLIITVP